MSIRVVTTLLILCTLFAQRSLAVEEPSAASIDANGRRILELIAALDKPAPKGPWRERSMPSSGLSRRATHLHA
jgi:hypothetical protein